MKKLFLSFLLTISLACVTLAGGDGWSRAGTHQTNNTTWTPVSSTCNSPVIFMNVSNAGTSWIITVQTKESTPRILYKATAAVGNFQILNTVVPIELTNGVDFTFSGTAGVADFFFVYK